MTTIVQLSDIHMVEGGSRIYGGIDPGERLERALERVRSLPFFVELLLITGDLTENGTQAEAERLGGFLADCKMPVYVMPGNHDERDVIRQILGKDYMPLAGPANFVVELADLRIIAVDTTVAGQEFGMVGEGSLAWLQAELSKPGKPVILAMHHPPFKSHCRAMDQVGLRNAQALRRAIVAGANVQRIVCGHLHRGIFADWEGLAVSSAPSTSFTLPVETSGQLSSFHDEPCGFHLHVYEPGSGLVTHTISLEMGAGPFYF